MAGMLLADQPGEHQGGKHTSDKPINRLSMEEATDQMWERKAQNAETPEEAEAAEIKAYRQRQHGYRVRRLTPIDRSNGGQ